MPIIRTTLLKGFTTSDQKSELTAALTETLVNVLGEVTRPYIFSLVEEIQAGAWQVQGQIMTQEMIEGGRAVGLEQLAKKLTAQRVGAAYDVLAGGDRAAIEEYWDADIQWLVPGDSRVSGTKRGLDEFLAFMGTVGELSGGSFAMERTAVLVDGDTSVDLSHNTGSRDGSIDRKLDIDVAHVLRWREGKVVEGRGAIFGDGTSRFVEFWA